MEFLTDDLSDVKVQILDYISQKNEFQEIMDKAIIEGDKLKLQKKQLDDTIAQLNSDKETLSSDIDRLSSDKEKLETKMSELQLQQPELNKKMDELKSEIK